MVLAILMFEPAEISLEGIRGSGNIRVVQVVEHIGECLQEHPAGSLQVAEDPTTLFGGSDAGAETGFPVLDLGDELVPLSDGLDGHHLAEKNLEMFGFGLLGMTATPAKPLSLNMNQTSLDDDVGPDELEYPDDRRIAVHRGTAGSKVPPGQRLAERQEIAWPFGDIANTMEQGEVLGAHNGKESFVPFEGGAIEDQIGVAWKIALVDRRMGQPIVDDPVKGWWAVPTLFDQLSNHIAFDQPTLEPDEVTVMLVARIFPNEATTARVASPTLLLQRGFSKALKAWRLAVDAPFFWAWETSSLNSFNVVMHKHRWLKGF
jgi:hypothetical protein